MPGCLPGCGRRWGRQSQAWSVPQVAMGYDQQGSYVLLVDDKNVVERRSVKLGPQVGDRRVIEEGLHGPGVGRSSTGLLRAIPGTAGHSGKG